MHKLEETKFCGFKEKVDFIWEISVVMFLYPYMEVSRSVNLFILLHNVLLSS